MFRPTVIFLKKYLLSVLGFVLFDLKNTQENHFTLISMACSCVASYWGGVYIHSTSEKWLVQIQLRTKRSSGVVSGRAFGVKCALVPVVAALYDRRTNEGSYISALHLCNTFPNKQFSFVWLTSRFPAPLETNKSNLSMKRTLPKDQSLLLLCS